MGRAYFDVSLEMVKEFLKLPASAKVTAVAEHTEVLFISQSKVLRVFVESEEFPESSELTHATPQYSLITIFGQGEMIVKFAGWGI